MMINPYIFIVYQNFEHDLASNLKRLLEAWGYEAFYCRQSLRDGKAYREELRKNMLRADVVILLISREFQWSSYCQAEAGTAMALEKECIPILVPPATDDEVKTIAPVIEGIQYISATDSNFLSLLRSQIKTSLVKSNNRRKELIKELQGLERVESSQNHIDDAEAEGQNRGAVTQTVKNIAEEYRLCQPKRTNLSTWPTLGDDACKASIKGNIKKSLKSDSGEVVLIFVGVSLKFSLHLITESLKELSTEAGMRPYRKPRLTIQLIHMDEHSHILSALEDTLDIRSIRDNFGAEWPNVKEQWNGLCGDTIDFVDPVLYRIDYIPPRVGLLIEDKNQRVLYEGQCSFIQTHSSSKMFNLHVGENPYLFYRYFKDPEVRGQQAAFEAIEKFNYSLNAYKSRHNNSGVTPVWDSDSWLIQLGLNIDRVTRSDQITFISGSATKFEKLILKALEKGAAVRSYISDGATPPLRLKDIFGSLAKENKAAAKQVILHRYQHPATFRALVIRDKVIGLQTYVNAGGHHTSAECPASEDIEVVSKLPICLIITPCFEHFAELQQKILGFAKDDPLASEEFRF